MKRLRISIIIVLLLAAFNNCEKLKDPAGERNAAGVPLISDINPGIFDSKDLVNSYVGFTLSLPNGMTADRAIIEASYDGQLERTEITEITSFPATVKIVSGDVIQKLGLVTGNIVNGDVFVIEVLLVSGGRTTRSNAVLNVSVACAFEETLAVGSYHSVSPPDQWNSEGDITITGDQSDPYTVYVSGIEALEGVNEDMGPLVMHIDPATYAVTAVKTVIASSAFGYHNLAYGGSGVYNSCDGSYQMNFDITVDEGSFGRYAFTFTRNP
jgi:hypothetical protein